VLILKSHKKKESWRVNGEMLVSPGPTPEAGPCGLGESRHPGRQSISGETEPDPKQ